MVVAVGQPHALHTGRLGRLHVAARAAGARRRLGRGWRRCAGRGRRGEPLTGGPQPVEERARRQWGEGDEREAPASPGGHERKQMRVVFSIGLGNNIGLRGGTQLFRADAVGAFNDLQAALNHIQNTQIGDNSIYHAGSGQGQAALL